MGFLGVTILGFRPGSVVVDYQARFSGERSDDVVDLANDIEEKTIEMRTSNVKVQLQNMSLDIDVDDTILQSKLGNVRRDSNGNKCAILLSPCDVGYECKYNYTRNSIECVHLCSSYPDYCKNGGQCSYNERSSTESLQCTCTSDDDYVYSGDHCENRQEKLSMSSSVIIAVAAGGGSAVVVVLIIIIIVLVIKYRRSKKAKYLDDSRDNPYSYELGMCTDRRPARAFPPYHDNQGHHDDGTRVLDGREHRVVRDEYGEETYVYQPGHRSSRKSPSTEPTMPEHEFTGVRQVSKYDYIDTDVKYSIQRPHVRQDNWSEY